MSIWRSWNEFIINRKIKHKKPYLIIPFGTYCLPRVITVQAKIKPTKQQGEKSFPFDLGFTDIEKNIQLLETHFAHFFDGVKSDSFAGGAVYKNDEISAIFNHDGVLTMPEFKERYQNRIKNLYDALQNRDKHVYILIATWAQIDKQQFERLKNIIRQYRPDKSYDIIYINQSLQKIRLKIPNVHIINQGYNHARFEKINEGGLWLGRLHDLNMPEAVKFYYDVVHKILNAMR